MEVFIKVMLDADNIVFTIIILAVFIFGVINRNNSKNKILTPYLAVSIGIFGTFWGILQGLQKFDQNRIQESIPNLLGGMKTAFVTSLLGMAAAMVLKIIFAVNGKKESPNVNCDPLKCLLSVDKGIQSLNNSCRFDEQLNYMKLIQQDIAELKEKNQNSELCDHLIEIEGKLVEINKACGGGETGKTLENIASGIFSIKETFERCFKSDADYSIPSQVSLIRTSLIDCQREMKKAFETFTEQFSKMASESLVEELKKVVDNFNCMLQDLVAQEFRELKDSTVQLNSWQASYKETIEKNQTNLAALLVQISSLNEVYNGSIKKIDDLSEKLCGISEVLDKISLSGDELAGHSKNLANQNELLKVSIETIKEAGEKAKELVPSLNTKLSSIFENVNDLQTKINEFVEKITKELKQNAEVVSDTSQKQVEAVKEALTEGVNRSLESFKKSTEMLSQRQNDMISKCSNLQEETNEFVVSVSSELENNAKNITKTSEKQVEIIKETLNTALDAYLKSFKETSDGLNEKEKQIIENIKSLSHEANELVVSTSKELKENSKKIADLTSKEIQKIDESLEKELNESMRILAGTLAKLSQTFANDYKPLTDKLRKVLEIAERLDER